MIRRDREKREEQENEETRMQGKKRKSTSRFLSTYLLVRSSNRELEGVETAYDRIPATNRRFRL